MEEIRSAATEDADPRRARRAGFVPTSHPGEIDGTPASRYDTRALLGAWLCVLKGGWNRWLCSRQPRSPSMRWHRFNRGPHRRGVPPDRERSLLLRRNRGLPKPLWRRSSSAAAPKRMEELDPLRSTKLSADPLRDALRRRSNL